jgi:universal stress protein E
MQHVRRLSDAVSLIVNFTLRRILVAIRDTHHVPRSALRKAATLARATGARIELFHAISEPVAVSAIRRSATRPSFAETERLIARRHLTTLERISRTAPLRGLRVECAAIWDYPPHEAIIRAALATKADLVIAGAQPRGFGKRLLLANTDWELIRQCPCPVLLVKARQPYDRPLVLAAVDPFHAHAKPAQLDKRILEIGSGLAGALRGELHIAHAYMPLTYVTPGPAGHPLAVMLPREYEDVHTGQVRRVFDELAQQFGIAPRRRHLLMGEVKGQLVALSRRTRARIMIMGAVSRSALRRAFIGSTAEHTLDELNCDVLIVKPRAFRTSVTRARQARARP